MFVESGLRVSTLQRFAFHNSMLRSEVLNSNHEAGVAQRQLSALSIQAHRMGCAVTQVCDVCMALYARSITHGA
jgi:hypothetical protein